MTFNFDQGLFGAFLQNDKTNFNPSGRNFRMMRDSHLVAIFITVTELSEPASRSIVEVVMKVQYRSSQFIGTKKTRIQKESKFLPIELGNKGY